MESAVVWARSQILDRHRFDRECRVGEPMRLLGGRPRMRTGCAFWFHSRRLVDGITLFISAIECLIRGRLDRRGALINKILHYPKDLTCSIRLVSIARQERLGANRVCNWLCWSNQDLSGSIASTAAVTNRPDVVSARDVYTSPLMPCAATGSPVSRS